MTTLLDQLLNQAIIDGIRSHITSMRRTPARFSNISSRYYNDPPRGGYHVNEEHEYILHDEDDITSLLFLDVITSFGSPSGSISDAELKIQRRNKIKQIKYRKVKEPTEHECAICLDTLKVNEFQRTLDCSHCFHKKCIDRWFKKDNDCCPMCRTVIIK